MPPEAPESGYGPANYANQPDPNPFSALDNRINYNEMVHHQMITQFHQNMVRPSGMPLPQARQVATQGRFQFGVQGGQDKRFYERQAEMSRMTYGSTVASAALDIGMFGALEAAAGLAGGGLLASMALPTAVGMIPMHFINKGVQNSLDRRKMMHSISSDVEQYRDKLGFAGGLSYQQAGSIGRSLTESMSTPGQFFNKEQQVKIHKIGLSNDLLSAKGAGIDSGTIRQYEKNVKELISTTEDVVKLLQTTTEGGMSVIKELKNSGFTSMKAIRQQVLQAKAFGGLTGMGAQNMMQLGAAGAAAVQGTGWNASVGANLYQYGAAQAHMLAQGSPSSANAVARAGGTAQAGSIIGRFAMNVLQSGAGTRMAAFAMNPSDGTINRSKMNRMLSGQAGGYEIVTGGQSTGYAMGENRVRFQMFKQRMFNELNPVEQMQAVTSHFKAWSAQRPYSSADNKAYVYAGQYTNDPREQELIYEQLISNKGVAQIHGSMRSQEMALNEYRPKRKLGRVGRGLHKVGKEFEGLYNRAGESIVDKSLSVMNFGTFAYNKVLTGAVDIGDRALVGLGIYEDSKVNRAGYGDIKRSTDAYFGIGETSAASKAAFARASKSDIESLYLKKGKSINIDASKLIAQHGAEAVNYAMQKVQQSLMEGTQEYKKDPNAMKVLGKENIHNPTGWVSGMDDSRSSISSKHDKLKTNLTKALEGDLKGQAKAMEYIGDIRSMRSRGIDVSNMSYSGGTSEINNQVNEFSRSEGNLRNVNTLKMLPQGRLLNKESVQNNLNSAYDDVLGIRRASRQRKVSTGMGGSSISFNEEYNIYDSKIKPGAYNTTISGTRGTPIRIRKFDVVSEGLKSAGYKSDRAGVDMAMTRYRELSDISRNDNSYKMGEKDTILYNTIEKNTTKDQRENIFKNMDRKIMLPEVERREGYVNSAMSLLGGSFKTKASEDSFKDFYSRSLGLGGSLSKKEIMSNISKYDTQLTRMGMNTDIMKGYANKDDGSLTNYMAHASKSSQTIAEANVENVYSRAIALSRYSSGTETDADKLLLKDQWSNIKRGSDGKLTEDSLKRLAAEEKVTKLMSDKLTPQLLSNFLMGGAAGNSVGAVVRPPVLNYWNNRWVL